MKIAKNMLKYVDPTKIIIEGCPDHKFCKIIIKKGEYTNTKTYNDETIELDFDKDKNLLSLGHYGGIEIELNEYGGKKEIVNENIPIEISQCKKGCGCMTHTINSKCGKCGKEKKTNF